MKKLCQKHFSATNILCLDELQEPPNTITDNIHLTLLCVNFASKWAKYSPLRENQEGRDAGS